jgi:hypothetical protein
MEHEVQDTFQNTPEFYFKLTVPLKIFIYVVASPSKKKTLHKGN